MALMSGPFVRTSPIGRITSLTSRGMIPTAAMPVPGREAETLGLRPDVAHHECGAHRRGGEDRDTLVAAQDRAGDDAEVDDRLAPPVEDGIHERAERLTLPVARASVPSNMSKTPPTNTTIPPTVQ